MTETLETTEQKFAIGERVHGSGIGGLEADGVVIAYDPTRNLPYRIQWDADPEFVGPFSGLKGVPFSEDQLERIEG